MALSPWISSTKLQAEKKAPPEVSFTYNTTNISKHQRKVIILNYIYLDYNSTTPVDEEVLEAMMPYFSKVYGNPSSGHWYGKEAKQAVNRAREQVAELIGSLPEEIVFTAGGSESNNFALKGVMYANLSRGKHLITSLIEHPAIMKPALYLEEMGFDISYAACNSFGEVGPEDVSRELKDSTVMVSVMYANNEVGTIQPIAEIGQLTRSKGIYLHTDASQAVGKIPVNVSEAKVDLLTLCGHKFYGPKGIGALYIRKGTNIESFIHGSGHEFGMRAGTENVPSLVGLGKAAEIARIKMNEEIKRLEELRDYFFSRLQNEIGQVVLNGHPAKRLPNTLHVSFIGIAGPDILDQVPEICATTGAACADRAQQLSGVMKAMGVSEEIGMGSIRFSIGRKTTRDELDKAVSLLKTAIQNLREGKK